MAVQWLWRPMQSADLPSVLAIEAGSYSHPWTLGQLQSSLDGGHRCGVAVPADAPEPAVLGYAITMAGVDECHLLNLTVHRDWRRRGLGRWLLMQVCAEVRAGGHEALWLEVRQGNLSAIRLYEQAGFVVVGRRPGYYPALRAREDALLMTLTWPSGSAASVSAAGASDVPNAPPPPLADHHALDR